MSLLPAEKRTLELGTLVVISGMSFGVQVGGWPAWSALVGFLGYMAWTLVYSEATVQARLRRATRLALQPAEPMAPPP